MASVSAARAQRDALGRSIASLRLPPVGSFWRVGPADDTEWFRPGDIAEVRLVDGAPCWWHVRRDEVGWPIADDVDHDDKRWKRGDWEPVSAAEAMAYKKALAKERATPVDHRALLLKLLHENAIELLLDNLDPDPGSKVTDTEWAELRRLAAEAGR
jgi:hypothetical protein